MRGSKSIHPSPRRNVVTFEGLEQRQLMSAVSLPAVQLDRINPKLWQAVTDVSVGKQNQLVQNRAVRFDNTGAVQTYVRTTGDVSAAAAQLRAIGAVIDGISAEMNVVQAWIAPAQMGKVTGLPAVQSVDLPDYAITNVTSAGDTVHLADKVRTNFAAQGFTGAGVKVGVISDGVNHRANVGAAELPAVTVNPALPGNGDEGTAMLEIVHDLAPGAQLFFSGPATSLNMVDSINYLVAQGCDVIVDDLTFLGEHFFSDTAVANAAVNAINQGVTYISAAGNFAQDQHYQAVYQQGLSAFGGGRLHRFGAPGQEVNAVSIPNGSRFRAFLQWSDQPGASANDYDFYLFNSTTFAQLDSGISIQNGNDQPFEFVDWTNNTGSNVGAELWVVKKDAAAVREIEIITVGNSSLQFDTPADSIVGQQAANGVIATGAVSASFPDSIESFSSRGSSTIYTNFGTQTKTSRTVLDAVATDGVQTRVGQLGFFNNPFFGTSASAPHAAAMAALVIQANPALTPAQVAQTMADTATDLGAVGYDTIFGAGRYNALDAVYKAFKPATADMQAASDTGASNTDNLTSDSTPTMTGVAPAGAFVELFFDGIFKGSTQLAAGATTWTIVPAGGVSDGTHQATVRMSSGNTTLAANRSRLSDPLNFVVDTTKPVISNPQFLFDAASQRLTFTYSEDVAYNLIDGFDLTLTNTSNNTQVVGLDILAEHDAATKTTTFRFPNFVNNGSLTDGNYTATLNGVVDPAFNQANPLGFSFFVLAGDANRDRAVNIDDFGILATNFNTANNFSHGDFNYSGSVDIDDFAILAGKFNTALAPAAQPRGIGAASGLPSGSAFSDQPIDDISELTEVIA